MTSLLLKTFSNKISSNILDEFFRNLATFDFNANTGTTNTSYFFTITNTGANTVRNGDTVRYYTDGGGTVISGLSNGHLYNVTSANSTGFKLANVSTSSTIAFISGLSETHHFAVQNPSYYFAVSKHSPWDDENNPDTPIDNLSSVYSFQREMMFGKRLNRTDLAFMIRKISWVANTVYDHYDDTVEDLFDSNFYVLSNLDRVYKCLDNNNGSPSTIQPTGVLTTPFTTADNYLWKYMYTLSSANNAKFSTSTYIPVDVNTTISSASTNGSIEFVQIETGGSGYLGYATGYVQEVVSNSIFKVETSTTSTSQGFYTLNGFYIDSGTGEGQLTNITNYIVNTSGHYVTTSTNLDAPVLDTTSKYLISPRVSLNGDGTGFKAYSNVSTSGNTYSISGINILNRGTNYSYADAIIITNGNYGSGATLRPVLSPLGGHGYNQVAELGASYFCISTNFANNESTQITTNTKYRKAGIIYDPKQFSNAQLSYSNLVFSSMDSMSVTIDTAPDIIFLEGETIDGQTSNAQGIVAFSNNSYIEFSPVSGTFVSSEQIIGSNSAATGTIASINTSDISKFNNEVLYYDYFEAIQRSNTTTEVVKLLIAV